MVLVGVGLGGEIAAGRKMKFEDLGWKREENALKKVKRVKRP